MARPTGQESRIIFFAEIGSTLEYELARYDAVIFFESAAVGGMESRAATPSATSRWKRR
jgi:hypothetical protein